MLKFRKFDEKMKRICAFILFVLLNFWAFSQHNDDKKYTLNGYFSQMNQTLIDTIDGNWINDASINNRLKFSYFGVKNLTFNFAVRNRIIYGETIKLTPGYADNFDIDKGFFELSFNLSAEKSYVINSAIDRFNFSYEKGKFKATLGRQRINWGKTFVWNPNDLFNNYSFFDFDYVEKPGADALYLQYFRNYASSIEFAAKLNSDTNLTAALKYGFNSLGYDFQLVAGLLDDNDIATGFAWSGYIKQLTFRGEATYLQPVDNLLDTSGCFIATIGFDYMFANSLMIVGEFLYNQAAKDVNITNVFEIQQAPMNVKNLSFAEYNAVLQISYPATPLINVSFAGMYMNKFDMLFFSPNISFSLSQNADFSLVGQLFSGNLPNPITQQNERKLFTLIFLRLKYSF